jgi:hypothetical protein
MTRCTCGRFSPPTMRPRLELEGLTMATTVRCDDCDPSPLARQLRTHAALRASAALDKRRGDIARHHDREEVRAWREAGERRLERERPAPLVASPNIGWPE